VSNQPNLWNFHSSNFWFCSYFFFFCTRQT